MFYRMRSLHFYIAIVCVVLLWGCKQKSSDTLFQPVTNSGISFENTIESTDQNNVFKYRNFYNGGGVAAGDLNNDGLPDVFLQPITVIINSSSIKEIFNLKILLQKPG
jgi:hypothetical protein